MIYLLKTNPTDVNRWPPMDTVTEYPKLHPSVVTSVLSVVTGGFRWSVGTGDKKCPNYCSRKQDNSANTSGQTQYRRKKQAQERDG